MRNHRLRVRLDTIDAPQPYNADSERTYVLFKSHIGNTRAVITNRSSTLDTGWTRRYYTFSICATITTIHRTIGAMYCEEQYTKKVVFSHTPFHFYLSNVLRRTILPPRAPNSLEKHTRVQDRTSCMRIPAPSPFAASRRDASARRRSADGPRKIGSRLDFARPCAPSTQKEPKWKTGLKV